jgi:rod shape-determining protein MreD
VVTLRTVERVALVIFVVLLAQATLGTNLSALGAHPDLMVLLPVSAGLVAGARAGAMVGFAAGLVADLFLPAPFGLSALTYCLVGFGVGATLSVASANLAGVNPRSWWVASLAALAASVGAVMLYAVLGALIGQQQMLHLSLGTIATVVALANAVLAPLVVRLMGWAFAPILADEHHRAAVGSQR